MKPKFEKPDYEINDPSNYLLGFLYYNPSDKRVLVPKRKGRGWGGTYNFARYQSYLIIGAIIASVIVVIYLQAK